MNTYDEYAERFLAALYLETETSGKPFHSAANLHAKYGLKPAKPHWIRRMADEWQYSYFQDVRKILSGFDEWSFRLSPEGYRYVEANFTDPEDVRDFLTQGMVEQGEPAGVARGQSIPASDRVVSLDHNQPEYREIAQGLNELYEQVRQDNKVGETGEQRERLLKSLSAARELWSAAELRIIQIEVGVLMAVEDAAKAIVAVGKSVGSALLADAIKGFLATSFGIKF